MKSFKLVTILVISLLLILIVVQNTATVQARFLWMSAEVPAILLHFLTAAGGFALGLLVALLGRRSAGSGQE